MKSDRTVFDKPQKTTTMLNHSTRARAESRKEKDMTLTSKVCIATLTALALCLPAIEGRAATASLDMEIYSAYVWRGQVYNDEAVLQPSFTAESEWGLRLNAWGNIDLTDQFDVRGEFNEIDLTIAYSPVWELPFNVEVGVAEYAYPKEGNWEVELPEGHVMVAEDTLRGEDTDSRDVFLEVGTDKVILSPTLFVSYDFGQVKDFYLNLGISHSLPLMEDTLSLDLAASIGYGFGDYNEYYFGTDEAALNDGNVSATLAYNLTESISVSGKIQYTALLDSDIKDAAEIKYGKKDIVHGGVAVGYSF